jgi:lysophospholipase L1-like esterase
MVGLLTVVSGCENAAGEKEASSQVPLAAAQYSAGSTIQAEAFTSKSSPYPQLENNNTDMGYFDVGTWYCFEGVDMTNVSGLDLRIAAANTGGVFTVRLDSSTGTEIGRYTVSTATGGWSTWQTRSVALTASSGVHSLCLRGEGGYGICNTDSVTLTGASSVWTGTWGTAPQSCGDSFNQQTLRQVVRTSISGSSARVRLSNVFGTQTLNVGDVHIAQRASGSSIVSSTDRKVTFGGSSTTSIPVGGSVVSDAISFPVNSLADVVVSMYFPGPTGQVTCHQSGFQTNYVAAGDAAGNETLSVQQTKGSYYVLTNLDVQNASAEGAVVTLGASITDGYISSSDQNHRWPNYLAARLGGAGRTIGVLNEGISGNRLLADGAGQSALNRFDRDVLAQASVKWVIISDDPINDLGNGTATGDQLVSGLQTLISRAHQAGVKVLCSTLTPFQGANYWTSTGETGRTTVNAFVRSASSGCDGVVDQDAATHDPVRPTWYLPAYDAGDHLHPNEAGLQAIAKSVGLNLFVP